jgi:probable HAF family extracellular repeat protein
MAAPGLLSRALSGGQAPSNRYIVVDLGALRPSFRGAHALSELGAVAGWSGTASAEPHPLLYAYAEGTRKLSTLGGHGGQAFAVNVAGQVVGWARTKQGAMHAFLLSAGQMRDLGTLGGDASQAAAINGAGQVVGWSAIAGGARRAFLYADGAMIAPDAGWTLNEATDINTAGQIVGWGAHGGEARAFLLTPHGAGAPALLVQSLWVP